MASWPSRTMAGGGVASAACGGGGGGRIARVNIEEWHQAGNELESIGDGGRRAHRLTQQRRLCASRCAALIKQARRIFACGYRSRSYLLRVPTRRMTARWPLCQTKIENEQRRISGEDILSAVDAPAALCGR